MVGKHRTSKAFCMLHKRHTHNWTSEPFAVLSTSCSFFSAFLASFSHFCRFDWWVHCYMYVCVIHLIHSTECTKTSTWNEKNQTNELKKKTQTFGKGKIEREKTKAIWCEWINGYSFFVCFLFKFLFHWHAKSIRSLHTWSCLLHWGRDRKWREREKKRIGQLPLWIFSANIGWW